MPGPPAATVALSVSTLLLAIGAGFGIARAVHRRERRRSRQLARDLEVAFADYLANRMRARELARSVRDADEATFWTALEAHAGVARRADRRKLARALQRNRYDARERRALRDDSPWRRELAARRLSLLCAPASRRALRLALGDGPEIVTFTAASGLARVRDVRALRWILDHPRALATRRPGARAALLGAFGRRARPLLVEALERDSGDPGFERALVDVLGRARERAAVPAILRRLAHANFELRVAAAKALGRIEAAESGLALIACLHDDAWQVRSLAAWALGRARIPAAIAPLAAGLSDRSWWVRRHAAYALAALGSEGREALRRVIESSPDPYARDMAVEALDGLVRARA